MYCLLRFSKSFVFSQTSGSKVCFGSFFSYQSTPRHGIRLIDINSLQVDGIFRPQDNLLISYIPQYIAYGDFEKLFFLKQALVKYVLQIFLYHFTPMQTRKSFLTWGLKQFHLKFSLVRFILALKS